ncbi:uncharacterized protein ACO6RY_01612 [Pungitius sinensis]
MQRRTQKLGAQLPPCVPAGGSQRRLFMKASTYLAKIAVVLQEAPDKTLTFNQLINRLTPLICQDRKSVMNIVSVTLSINRCFVKIPVVDSYLDCRRKRINWKLDLSQITEKMVRRHFRGILHLFPELESKVGTNNRSTPEPLSAPHAPEPAASRDVQIRCEVKFSSPFSIESLLKRDSPSARASGASPPTDSLDGRSKSSRWGSEERLLLTASAGSSSIWSLHHGPSADGAAQPISGMKECSQPSLLVLLVTPPSHYITYSRPTFTHDAL